MEDTMLTTKDNPFDPFTQFWDWHQWDQRAGYYTLSILDRVVADSDELSEDLQAEAIEQAFDTMISEDPRNMYVKVHRTVSRA